MNKDKFPLFSAHPDLAYLDNAATTQKPKQVIDAMTNFYETQNANVHRGGYKLGSDATNLLEEARSRVATFIGADNAEVSFTSGTTEGLNLVARMIESSLQPGDEIVVMEDAHHANFVPWQQLCERAGIELVIVPVSLNGVLDDVDKYLSAKTKLVAITHVSNVLGTESSVKEIVKVAHDHGALVLVDGAQAVGHIDVQVKDLACDFYVFSGHKMYGPMGIGVLYGRSEVMKDMTPAKTGGGVVSSVTEDTATFLPAPIRFEAGTPNVAGAVGLAAAIEFIEEVGIKEIRRHEQNLTDITTEKLSSIDGVTIFAPESTGSIVSFIVDGVHAHDLATVLDEQNIAVRAGHHCAMPLHGKLGVPATCRVSFALYNDESEIDRLIEGVQKAKQLFV